MSKPVEIRRRLLFALAPCFAVLPAGCRPPAVQVVPVETGAVESTATSIEPGLVKARQDSSLAAPVSGRIVEILHKKGDRVKAKEPLIRLENDLERILLDEARLAFKRVTSLGPSGIATAELLDQARFALDRAETNYERTFVRSPFAGVLVDLNANLGEMAYGTLPLNLVLGGKGSSSEKSMARVVDDSRLHIEADVDEADAGRLKIGQQARITLEAMEDAVLPGRVDRISQFVSTAEGRSRTVQVEIGFEPDAPLTSGAGGPALAPLLVGMSADIEIILERVEGVLKVPTLVILEGEVEKSVFLVEEGKLRRRQVKVGASNWEFSEIREGLRQGDLVVIPSDRKLLVEGAEVRAERRQEKP